jgi:hypothetical protein
MRKKVRGSKRKLRSLAFKIDSVFRNIPEENFSHDKYWKYHLPSTSKLIDSINSSSKLRRRFLQLLIDNLVKLDIIIKDKYNALLFVSFPFLSHSRIDIRIDRKLFETLINNTEWTSLKSERNIIKEMDLALPKEYKVKGYIHIPADSNTKSTEEYWIIWKDR